MSSLIFQFIFFNVIWGAVVAHRVLGLPDLILFLPFILAIHSIYMAGRKNPFDYKSYIILLVTGLVLDLWPAWLGYWSFKGLGANLYLPAWLIGLWMVYAHFLMNIREKVKHWIEDFKLLKISLLFLTLFIIVYYIVLKTYSLGPGLDLIIFTDKTYKSINQLHAGLWSIFVLSLVMSFDTKRK